MYTLYHQHSSRILTLVLIRVATKAATTTMETTILTVVETLFILIVCLFPVDQCKRDEVSNYELRMEKGLQVLPGTLHLALLWYRELDVGRPGRLKSCFD
jgi:hypothetical protein